MKLSFDDAIYRVNSSQKSFSLLYNQIAHRFFIGLAFAGGLSACLFGIPLIPLFFITQTTNISHIVFSFFSILGCVWGIMGYREFTTSANRVYRARELAQSLDPMIGNYDYKSYNPETHEFEEGYIPLGPIDFWDKETYAPSWLDKGKYWHVLLGLQVQGKEIVLQVSRDTDLPLESGRRNVAVTIKENLSFGSASAPRKRFRYRVKIPQWVVMSTDNAQLKLDAERSKIEINSIVSELNRQLFLAADEILEREKPRIKYPWHITGLAVYLNKSLPIRIIYKEVMEKLPGFGKSIIQEANETLADMKEEKLLMAVCQLASKRGVQADRIDSIGALAKYLNQSYEAQGLGEGSTKYHNFHHSLEVTYLCLQLIPTTEFHGYKFFPNEIEMVVVAGLLHDHDPMQVKSIIDSNGLKVPEAPKVSRTIEEIQNTRIHDAYFVLNAMEFERFFPGSPRISSSDSTFRPEFPSTGERPYESLVVEAIIWRTDFPYSKQKNAQEMFARLLAELRRRGQDTNKITLLAEIVWLADLSVTYMGSDPLRAWNRVTSLYDELFLSKLEAVSRTDTFFSDFADKKIFQELLKVKSFPEIFRNRWNLVYQFFHEGNPSTSLNRTIENAHKLFLKVNMEIGMLYGKMMYFIASNNWGEYFIGIGKNHSEVSNAKAEFVCLEPQNASAFWGEPKKLIPNMPNGSIDNFLLRMPKKYYHIETMQDKLSIRELIEMLPNKLRGNGTLQILTDIPVDDIAFKDLSAIMREVGFSECLDNGTHKTYFPTEWTDEDFSEDTKPRVALFCSQLSR